MGVSLQLVAILAACTVLYAFVNSFSRKQALAKLGKDKGCQPMHRAKTKLPMALDRKLKVIKFKGDILQDLIFENYKEEGKWTYTTDSNLDTSIFSAEPKICQAILATNFQDWGLGNNRARAVGPLLGPGVFTSDGPIWQHSRAVLRPNFTRDLVSDLAAPEKHVKYFFQAIKYGPDGWTTNSDLLPLILRYTLDNTTEFICGESVNSQLHFMGLGTPSERQQAIRLEKAFKDSNDGVLLRLKAGPFYWMANSKKFRDSCASWKDYGDRFVEKALRSRSAPKQAAMFPEKEKYSFLQGLVDSTQDKTLLRDLTIQLLFAGEDTSASLLAFSIRCLAHHKGSWERLRKEVLEKYGTENHPTNKITFANLKECEYLQNIMKETLRLYPPIPMNGREALRDTVLPSGGGPDGTAPVVVAKGTVVKYSPYVMQRREDLWGPDAGEWKPDRWIGKRVGWEYIPFNGGPRICIGQQFALTEVAIALVRIMQHYDQIQCMHPEEKISTRFSTALFPLQGVPIKFHRASD